MTRKKTSPQHSASNGERGARHPDGGGIEFPPNAVGSYRGPCRSALIRFLLRRNAAPQLFLLKASALRVCRTRKTCVIAAFGVVGLAATASVGKALGDVLIVNGKSTPVETKVIGGATYVKLSDVAKAFDVVVVKKGPGQYELIKAGGANQIGSLTGKIGDTLFDGKWKFTVLSVETVPTFTMKSDAGPYGASGQYSWNQTTHLLSPTKGNILVVIQCRIANGVKEKRTLWTAPSDERIRTALADMNGSSYAPIGYDFTGAPTQTEWLLPGAQLTFPVLFSVPEGTKLKDLVFTLKNNQGDEKGTDVRVSLQKE